MISTMVLVRSALSTFIWGSVCLACGATSGHDDTASSSGGTSSAAGALSGASGSGSNAGGKSNNGGGTQSAGASNGGASSGGTSSGGTSSSGASSGGASSGAAGNGATIYTGPGTVTDVWTGVCVATFTADYQVTDAFQKPLFTALTGEKYLIERLNEVVATMAYLTPNGPISFDVSASAPLTLPFTSNCGPNPPNSYFAVFADVSIFAEPGLTTKLCDLKNGDKVLRDSAKNAGYALKTSGATSSVYQVFLNAFSAQCDNADNGYISVTTINVLGSRSILVPFAVIGADG